MATEMHVEAVGTDNGRPVVFLTDGGAKDLAKTVIVPTDNITMAKLAAMGLPIRNSNEVPLRRRR